VDHVRIGDRSDLPARLRPAAGRLVRQAEQRFSADPIGALTTILPTWYLFPFAIVAVLGLVGGRAGHLLVGPDPAGRRAAYPRYVAAMIDGTLMIAGTIYVVFFSHNFIGPFQGFLSRSACPSRPGAGSCWRHRAAQPELYRRGPLRHPRPVRRCALGFGRAHGGRTIIGWGLVTNTSASWLKWQGYLLGPFGLGGKTAPGRSPTWAWWWPWSSRSPVGSSPAVGRSGPRRAPLRRGADRSGRDVADREPGLLPFIEKNIELQTYCRFAQMVRLETGSCQPDA